MLSVRLIEGVRNGDNCGRMAFISVLRLRTIANTATAFVSLRNPTIMLLLYYIKIARGAIRKFNKVEHFINAKKRKKQLI